MAALWENLRREKNERAKARLMWEHYVSRKRDDALEPNWVHPAYALAYSVATGEKLDSDDLTTFRQMVGSHELEDGHVVRAFPHMPEEFQGPARYVHDGWKLATPSWVFMARNQNVPDFGPVIDVGNGWVVVGRDIPDKLHANMQGGKTIYIAYNLNVPMGITAMTANVLGPTDSHEEIMLEVERERKQSSFSPDQGGQKPRKHKEGKPVHDGQHHYKRDK